MPLPLNISIEIYPGKYVPTICCAKTQESLCLKSSIGQLLMWTSGLLFSEEKTSDYSLSSCMQHTQGRQDEDNVESFSSSGSVMRLPVSTPGLVQQLLWFIRFFSSVSTARFIDIITMQSFPNLNISIKHRQIGGQNVRFALHNRF